MDGTATKANIHLDDTIRVWCAGCSRDVCPYIVRGMAKSQAYSGVSPFTPT